MRIEVEFGDESIFGDNLFKKGKCGLKRVLVGQLDSESEGLIFEIQIEGENVKKVFATFGGATTSHKRVELESDEIGWLDEAKTIKCLSVGEEVFDRDADFGVIRGINIDLKWATNSLIFVEAVIFDELEMILEFGELGIIN